MPSITIPFNKDIGPVIDAFYAVSRARQNALVARNLELPSPVQVRLLIDTGASTSCIDPAALAPLGLSPTGLVPVITPSTGSKPVDMPQYDVRLIIPGPMAKAYDALPVTACSLGHQGFQGLIGRDVLSQCVFVCNGEAGIFTLCI